MTLSQPLYSSFDIHRFDKFYNAQIQKVKIIIIPSMIIPIFKYYEMKSKYKLFFLPHLESTVWLRGVERMNRPLIDRDILL